MNYLVQIQRAIDFIEDHLEEDIALPDVSRHAGVSHWHFQRMFRALTKETLKSYIRSRRLANARLRLAAGHDSIIDVAIAAGFDSQASFTRAFKKAFGIPPAQYRSLGDRHLFLHKVRIDEAYIRQLSHGDSSVPQIVELPARHFVGMRTTFYSVDSERNNIGAKLPPLWASFLPRLGDIDNTVGGACYGVIEQVRADSARLRYTACAEVSRQTAPPADMLHFTLPSSTYAIFAHHGAVENIDHTVNYIYSAWMLRSGRRHSYGADIEIYGARYQAASATSVMHYAVPICDVRGA